MLKAVIVVTALAAVSQQPIGTPPRGNAPVNQSAKPAQNPDERQEQQSDARKPVPTPAQPDANELARERSYREREIAIQEAGIRVQESIARFTRALVWIGGIVGCLQVLLMLMTWFVTNKAAEAAKRSADVASDGLALTQRAYLSVGKWEFRGFEADKEPTVRFVIENTGNTPAHLIDLGSICRIRQAKESLPSPPDYQGITILREHNEAVNPKTMNERLIRLPVLNAKGHAAIMDGSHKLWFLGYLTFRTFEKIKTVRFCVLYSPTLKRFLNDHAPGYNEAD